MSQRHFFFSVRWSYFSKRWIFFKIIWLIFTRGANKHGHIHTHMVSHFYPLYKRGPLRLKVGSVLQQIALPPHSARVLGLSFTCGFPLGSLVPLTSQKHAGMWVAIIWGAFMPHVLCFLDAEVTEDERIKEL